MTANRIPRPFTWEELAELNERRNVHVAVRGKVYDLTTFVDSHPGGIYQMLLGAGRDVTQLFEMYHDFSVYKVLEKYYVGELLTNELPVYAEAGKFAKVLREKVKNRFKELRVDPKDPCWTLMRYFWIFLGLSFFWYLQVRVH
jgi:cytochrome b involved in lipid metabolism